MNQLLASIVEAHRALLAERLADLRPGTSREPPPPGDTPLT